MKRVIIDTDPGHDDALAILLALSSPELKVEAITTVAGNQTVDKTTANALKILTVAGRADIPVAAGMSRPLIRRLRVATSHGETGLDGPDLPEPAFEPVAQHAVDLIIETLNKSSEKITLIPIGPLTNIAMVLIKEPAIKEKIERIVLMGGALGEGNTTPVAEFNIYVDPDAAQIVFHSGVPVTMVGLNVTHKAIVTHEEFKRIVAMGRPPVSTIIGDILSFYTRYYDDFYGFGGAPIHDACAVAEVICPGIIEQKLMYVDVETQSELTRGQTVCDVWGLMGRPANVSVGVDIDVPRFKELLFRGLTSY